MAYEKNIQYDKMKTLILMLIGLPLMASTNIDCGGRSFHCVNATHFLICVDVGGGVSATVDHFMIGCPPPTLCLPDNRFECELPPPTQPIPSPAVSVLPIMPVKVKETTEEFLEDTISSNTEVEQHLELSTINTMQDPVTAVIPLEYSVVNETMYSVSGKDQTKLLGSTVDSNNTKTVIVRTNSEVDNENNTNTLLKSNPTPTTKDYINSTNDYIKNESSSVMSTRIQNTVNSTTEIVDIKDKSSISSVLNANMNETENIRTRTTISTTNLKNDNITELVAVTEYFKIYTNTTEIKEANNSDIKNSELSAKNNGLISDVKESENVKNDTLTNYNTNRTTSVITKVTNNLQNLEIITGSLTTDKGETFETTTSISVERPITDTSTTDFMDMKTTEPFSLSEIIITQKQLSERAIAPTPNLDFLFTTHVFDMADSIHFSTFKNITEDVFIDSTTPTTYNNKNEITQDAVIDSSTLSDIVFGNNEIESFNITKNKTARENILNLPTEFISATETSDIIIFNTTDTYKPIQKTTQPAVSRNKEKYAQASILEDGINENESSNKVVITSPGQLENKTLDNKEIRNMIAKRKLQTLKTTVDSFIDSIEPAATSTTNTDSSFATVVATIKYEFESSTQETKILSNITTKTENTHDTFEPIEEVIHKDNEIIFKTIPISTINTTFELMDQNVNTDDYSSSRFLDTTTKAIGTVDLFTIDKEPVVVVTLAETISKLDNETKNLEGNIIHMHDFIINPSTQIINDYHRTGQTELNISKSVTDINMINTSNIIKQYNTATDKPKSHLKPILTSLKPMENVESLSEVALINDSDKIRTGTEPVLIPSNEVIFKKSANISALNTTQINNIAAANVKINIYETEQPTVILTKLQESIVNSNGSSIHTFLETTITNNEPTGNYNEQTTMETLVVGTIPSDLIYNNNSSISTAANINTEQRVLSTTKSWVGSTPMIKDTEKHSLKAEPFKAKVNVDTKEHNDSHIVTTPHPNNNLENLYKLQKINNASIALYGQSQFVVNGSLKDIMPDRKLKYGENSTTATSIFDKYQTTEQLLAQYKSPPAEKVDTTIPISSSDKLIKVTEIDFLPVFTIENKIAPENSTSYNVFELGVEMTNTNLSMFKRNLTDTIKFENIKQEVITVNLAGNETKNSTQNYPANKELNESAVKPLLSLGNLNADAKLKSTHSIPESTVKSKELDAIINSYNITKNKNLTDAGIYRSKLTNNGYTELSDDSLLDPKIILQNPVNDILLNSTNNVVEDSTMSTISETNKESTRNIVQVIDGVVKIIYENHTEPTLFQDSNVTEITPKYFSATKPSMFLQIATDHFNDLNNFSLTTMTVPNVGVTPVVFQNINDTIEKDTNLIPYNINESTSIDATRSTISVEEIFVEVSSNEMNYNLNGTGASSSDSLREPKDNEISRGIKIMLNAFNTSVVETNLSSDLLNTKPGSNWSLDNAFEFGNIEPTVNIRTVGVTLIDQYSATSESIALDSDDKRVYNPDDTVTIDISDRYTSLQINNSTFGLDSIPYVTPTSLLSTEGQKSYSLSIPPEILLTSSTLDDIRKETLATNENTNIISESFINVDTISAVTTSLPFVASNSIQQNIYADAMSMQHKAHQTENYEDISYVIENNKEIDVTSLPTKYLISSFDKETTKTYEASTSYTEGVTRVLPKNESKGQITTMKAMVIGITENDDHQTLSKFISKLNEKVDERENKTLTSTEQEQNQITLKQRSSAAVSSNMELESINETENIDSPFLSKESTERAMNQTVLDVIERSIATENVSLITTDNISNQTTSIFQQGSPTMKKEFTITPVIGSEMFAEGHTIQALVSTKARSFFNGAREAPVANTVKIASPIHTTPETISVLVPPSTTSPMTSSIWESVSTEATAFSCALRPAGRYAEPEDNDCRKFYVCSGMTHPIVVGLCPPNTVFSEIRKQCTRKLSHCIRKNEFKCVSPGRFGDFMQPNLYYICVKKGDVFLRYKLQCQKGYYLNKTTVHCTKVREVTSSNLPVSSSTSLSAEGRQKQHESSSEKTEVFKCLGEGTFADPYNCRGYYTCKRVKSSDVKYRRKRKTCDQDEVFDREKKKCVDGESSECRHCDSESPNVYYVYVRRQEHHWLRFKLQCRVGYILNTTTVRCYKTQLLTSSQSASEDESTSADADKRSPSGGGAAAARAAARVAAFRCASAGRFPLPEPRDADDDARCRRYIECKVTRHNRFKQKRKKCKKFQVFDAAHQKCVKAAESLECR